MSKRLALGATCALFYFFTLSCTQGFAADQAPSLVLNGSISREDFQTYKFVPFAVPEGTRRITIEFAFTGADQKTVIDLGLFDESGFRGWGGGGKKIFTISATDATPSFLPGIIRPGEWKLLLGIPNIREGVRAQYTAKIYFSSSEREDCLRLLEPPLRSAASWYKGDLHMHTGNSDGSCLSKAGKKVSCPVFKTVEAASNRGLDFIAITDHNTISHYQAIRELQPYFDNVLLIRGREITTFQGHANVFGTSAFIDFRVQKSGRSINDFLRQARQLGGLVSLNHPAVPSGEMCMGCGWSDRDQTDFSLVSAIEVVNGDQVEGPLSGIPFWQEELVKGIRLTAIGGSDNHQADLSETSLKGVGTPTTVVFSKELSETAILDGIRQGHVYIMTEGTKGHPAQFKARQNDQEYSMGDNLKAPAGSIVEFFTQVNTSDGAQIEMVHNARAERFGGETVAPEGRVFRFTSDGQRHWFRLNIRSADGKLLTLTNPIYLNFK